MHTKSVSPQSLVNSQLQPGSANSSHHGHPLKHVPLPSGGVGVAHTSASASLSPSVTPPLVPLVVPSSSGNSGGSLDCSLIEDNSSTKKFQELCKSERLANIAHPFICDPTTCEFAHTYEQLQPKLFSGRFKTVWCKNGAACLYKSRCKFFHNELSCLGRYVSLYLSTTDAYLFLRIQALQAYPGNSNGSASGHVSTLYCLHAHKQMNTAAQLLEIVDEQLLATLIKKCSEDSQHAFAAHMKEFFFELNAAKQSIARQILAQTIQMPINTLNNGTTTTTSPPGAATNAANALQTTQQQLQQIQLQSIQSALQHQQQQQQQQQQVVAQLQLQQHAAAYQPAATALATLLNSSLTLSSSTAASTSAAMAALQSSSLNSSTSATNSLFNWTNNPSLPLPFNAVDASQLSLYPSYLNSAAVNAVNASTTANLSLAHSQSNPQTALFQSNALQQFHPF